MKLSEFIALPEDHKRATVLTEGVAIAKRELTGQLVFLFQLQGFYVETFCCCKSKEIIEYLAFYDTKHLEPYLDAIRIVDLLN